QARGQLLRAQIAFTVNRGRDAHPLLLNAAGQLAPLDVRLARETYLEALSAAMFAGASAGDGVRQTAEAARAAPRSAQAPAAADLLLEGLAVRFTDGYAAAVPTLRRALDAFGGSDLAEEDGLRWLWLACTTATHVWDYETWQVLATRFVESA